MQGLNSYENEWFLIESVKGWLKAGTEKSGRLSTSIAIGALGKMWQKGCWNTRIKLGAVRYGGDDQREVLRGDYHVRYLRPSHILNGRDSAICQHESFGEPQKEIECRLRRINAIRAIKSIVQSKKTSTANQKSCDPISE